MGRPVHYSSEVPARCQALIEMLADKVLEDGDPEGRWGGPLKTTFLLAMATPMVVLPIERLFKPVVWGAGVIANEEGMDPGVSRRVAEDLGPARRFEDVSFFRKNAWSYIADSPAFPVSNEWPKEVLDELAGDGARQAAAAEGAGRFLYALRNSLAHGGVTYLDRDGRHTYSATNMLGFASLVKARDPTRLRLLRVSVDEFQIFLKLWAGWLAQSGLERELALGGPGYFQVAAE